MIQCDLFEVICIKHLNNRDDADELITIGWVVGKDDESVTLAGQVCLSGCMEHENVTRILYRDIMATQDAGLTMSIINEM